MNVAESMIKCLELEGIDTVFGYPGGAILPFFEALRRSKLKHILVRNEQSAVHAASGYARVSKKVGVCISTSGPGATNMITGIATAYMDSIPLIAITGQVRKDFIGKDVFQEVDILGATEPFTKHSFLVTKSEDILTVMAKAIKIATTGRMGPVLIDIPRDIQMEEIEFKHIKDVEINGYNPTVNGHTGQLKRIIKRVNEAKSPVIIAGGGVLLSGAKKALTHFSVTRKIPVINTLMGISSYPMDSPYYVGVLGSHGDDLCEQVVKNADLIIVIGARMSDRATKNFSLIRPEANIVHIDIDPSEIGKIINYQIPVVGDAKTILDHINKKIEPNEEVYWLETSGLKCESHTDIDLDAFDNVNPKHFLNEISKRLTADAVVTADVGQNQIWTAKNIQYSQDRKFLSSGGLGTMGYSLPAGIGAKLAAPEKMVVSVMGDAGIQMLLGELGTLSEIGHKVIVIILNNNLLGMVRELQDGAYGKKSHFGIHFSISPDFVKIGEGYGIPGRKIESNSEIQSVLDEAFQSESSFIIDVRVSPEVDSL
ncbi:biosynthetic-type acetolactate synthase large subunit [Fusibacter ferrireducens]|uniref:Acetolactate synthase n=1 Tax=Fusibacter ferrireducens TaxID=2785058 RepID=A0ABR9ZUY1_9FIRM|nr:biosynthetic-type acetolactate synthase large subunit [Fusibacter ferrireducens]MBF4694272.1 biosynthetic-type acetolactate synthase large subunit [Fusibacter ferrireducens]